MGRAAQGKPTPCQAARGLQGSFPRLWMTSLTSLKRSVLHHFTGYEWHLWLHWKGLFCIISQAMNDIFDFIEKVSSGSFPRLWMISLTSLKRSVLDHFPGYDCMNDIFDFIQKISSTSFAKFWSMNDIFDFIEKVSFASFPWLLNDIFDFSEKVSSGSFPRLWVTALSLLKR